MESNLIKHYLKLLGFLEFNLGSLGEKFKDSIVYGKSHYYIEMYDDLNQWCVVSYDKMDKSILSRYVITCISIEDRFNMLVGYLVTNRIVDINDLQNLYTDE